MLPQDVLDADPHHGCYELDEEASSCTPDVTCSIAFSVKVALVDIERFLDLIANVIGCDHLFPCRTHRLQHDEHPCTVVRECERILLAGDMNNSFFVDFIIQNLRTNGDSFAYVIAGSSCLVFSSSNSTSLTMDMTELMSSDAPLGSYTPKAFSFLDLEKRSLFFAESL